MLENLGLCLFFKLYFWAQKKDFLKSIADCERKLIS